MVLNRDLAAQCDRQLPDQPQADPEAASPFALGDRAFELPEYPLAFLGRNPGTMVADA